MKGVPSKVEARGLKIFVKLGNINMPLGEGQYKELFGREPKDETEARIWAFRLRKGRKEVDFPNIRTKEDKKKREKVDGVNAEYKNIKVAEDKEMPTYEQVLKEANDRGVAVHGYTWDEKQTKLDIKLHVPRHTVDPKGQKEAEKKLTEVRNALGITGFDSVTNSD